MDRLVCGDVGFGKTEVALRAAFVAAMNGIQVAVVVPTTLLSRQHFKTFSERFSRPADPVVQQASRLVGAKELALTKKGSPRARSISSSAPMRCSAPVSQFKPISGC
jgi:transcription-repair coupling factor (superfamily II helicase)